MLSLFATSWTVARQAPLSMEFFRQKYWTMLPFPTGIELTYLVILALAGRFFTTETPGKPSYMYIYTFLVLQLLGCVQLFATRWTAACQASLSSSLSQSLTKLMFLESMMPSSHLILCCPLLFLPSIFPNIRVFSNELALHIRWPKYWRFRFSTSSSSEYSGLISFRINWFDLLAVIYVCVCVCVCVCVSLYSQLDNSTLF